MIAKSEQQSGFNVWGEWERKMQEYTGTSTIIFVPTYYWEDGKKDYLPPCGTYNIAEQKLEQFRASEPGIFDCQVNRCIAFYTGGPQIMWSFEPVIPLMPHEIDRSNLPTFCRKFAVQAGGRMYIAQPDDSAGGVIVQEKGGQRYYMPNPKFCSSDDMVEEVQKGGA